MGASHARTAGAACLVASGLLLAGPSVAAAAADSGSSAAGHHGSRHAETRAHRGTAVRETRAERRTRRRADAEDRSGGRTAAPQTARIAVDSTPRTAGRVSSNVVTPRVAVVVAPPRAAMTVAEKRAVRRAERKAARQARWASLEDLWCPRRDDDCGGGETPGQPAKPDDPGTPSAPDAPTPVTAVATGGGDGVHLVTPPRLGSFALTSGLPVAEPRPQSRRGTARSETTGVAPVAGLPTGTSPTAAVTIPVLLAVPGAAVTAEAGGAPAGPAAVPNSATVPRLVEAPPSPPTSPAPPSAIGSSKIDSPASAYRVGYGEYLRSAGFGEIVALALPGLAGMVVLTGAGGLLGYRQASAGRSVHIQGTRRFMD